MYACSASIISKWYDLQLGRAHPTLSHHRGSRPGEPCLYWFHAGSKCHDAPAHTAEDSIQKTSCRLARTVLRGCVSQLAQASGTTWVHYTIVRCLIDDKPTDGKRRNVDSFFSEQDCINFLRFSQSQVW